MPFPLSRLLAVVKRLQYFSPWSMGYPQLSFGIRLVQWLMGAATAGSDDGGGEEEPLGEFGQHWMVSSPSPPLKLVGGMEAVVFF